MRISKPWDANLRTVRHKPSSLFGLWLGLVNCQGRKTTLTLNLPLNDQGNATYKYYTSCISLSAFCVICAMYNVH